VTPTRRWVAAAIALVAAVALVIGFRGDTAADGATPPPAGATPMWSARRVPQPIVAAVGAQRLQGRLEAELGGDSTCVMVEGSGAFVAGRNLDTPLVPASAEKLFVAAAALDTLGPDFAFETRAMAAKGPGADGTLDRLFLVGSGDPVLSTDDFVAFVDESARRRGGVTTRMEAFADSIVAAGVRRVPGGVVGDDSRYDQQRTVEGWSPGYISDGDVGPLGALTVNDGNESLAPRRTAVDPALNATSVLTRLLTERGVQVGPPSRGVAPADAIEVAKVTSPALRDIVGSMLTTSDALTAELLAKELGVRATQQGTTAAGTAAVLATLQGLGVPVDGVRLVDASGLHRDNRATCRSLLDTLDLARQPSFATLVDGLLVVGERGTLVDQLTGLGLDGKLRGKTGFLNGVSSLVATVDAGQDLRFAFVDNAPGGYGQATAETIREDAVETLTTYPDAPDAAALVPAPA
jgi:D-alanyl-D-alanine carboxypeptidase/D-alanyl-D-alanine-endopeptidase (penicillin-binding protein 4)